MAQFLTNGIPSQNSRIFNRSIRNQLPNSNTHFSRCVSAHCRVLLNIQKLTDPLWQISPTPLQIREAQLLPSEISNQPIVSNFSLAPLKSTTMHGICTLVRDLFLSDIRNCNFPKAVFAWNEVWDSHWNQLFMSFIIKHWNHAHKHGAFTNFPFNSSHNNPFNLVTIIKRWFMGKKTNLRLGKFTPEAHEQKEYQSRKSRWRRQLSNNRTRVLHSLNLQEDQHDIFSESLCCSDTEVSSHRSFERVQCPWRSPAFSALGHHLDKAHDTMQAEKLGRRYKRGQSMWMLRKPSNLLQRVTKVPTNLSRNCYHPEFIASLSPDGIKLLDIQPPIDLAMIMSKLMD